MQALLFLVAGVVLLVLENLWRVRWPIAETAPALAALAVTFIAISGRAGRALVFAFLFGLALDALGGIMPGMHAVILVVMAYAISEGGKYFYLRSIPYQTIAIVLMSAALVFGRRAFVLLFEWGEAPGGLFAAFLTMTALNLAAGLPLFHLLAGLDERTSRDRHEPALTLQPW
ncbi:rod shape-determining protein MreD [bacterium]|nr:rod shape-determining protein MreD [bacterium]